MSSSLLPRETDAYESVAVASPAGSERREHGAAPESPPPPEPAGLAGLTTPPLHSLWRRLVLSRLRQMSQDRIHLMEAGGLRALGSGPASRPPHELHVHHPSFFSRVLWGADIGAGVSYAQGAWSSPDLTRLIRLFIRQADLTAGLEQTPMARAQGWIQRWRHRLRRNTPGGSRRNIAAHYDLGDDFFAAFLDETMTYSCGLFSHPQASLSEASVTKNEHICRTLDLQPEDHVVEVGCGWGSFAVHAASRYGCRVVAVTISRNQYEAARQRVRAAGMENRVEVILEDYRRLPSRLGSRFSKLVSIEMIEAVGHRFLGDYFSACSRLLRPRGAMLLQGILMSDHLYQSYLKTVDFIRACIFPGGCLASHSSIAESLARRTDMRISRLEDMTAHYPPTLMAWRRRLLAGRQSILGAGYGEDLIRLWDFYFCYCAAAFLERRIGVVQMLLSKPQHTPSAAPGLS